MEGRSYTKLSRHLVNRKTVSTRYAANHERLSRRSGSKQLTFERG